MQALDFTTQTCSGNFSFFAWHTRQTIKQSTAMAPVNIVFTSSIAQAKLGTHYLTSLQFSPIDQSRFVGQRF
jgi:hypothetical protein